MARFENLYLLKSANFFFAKELIGFVIFFKIFKHFKRIETFFSINLPIL
jgi:hypothetical protein